MTNLQLINEQPSIAYRKLITTKELDQAYDKIEASLPPLPTVRTMLEERQRTSQVLKIMVCKDLIRA